MLFQHLFKTLLGPFKVNAVNFSLLVSELINGYIYTYIDKKEQWQKKRWKMT